MTAGRRWVPAAVLGIIVAELVAFFGLGSLIGFGITILVVIAVSLLGAVLVRREGLRAWRGFREAAGTAAPPGPRVTDGVVGLGGALLLAAPGLVTGVAGALLLTPPVRQLARARVQARAERRMSSAEAGQVFGPRRVRVEHETPRPEGAENSETDVVEGEIVDDQ